MNDFVAGLMIGMTVIAVVIVCADPVEREQDRICSYLCESHSGGEYYSDNNVCICKDNVTLNFPKKVNK